MKLCSALVQILADTGTGTKDSIVICVLQVLVRERIRRILDPGTELWELCATAGLGLPYGDVS